MIFLNSVHLLAGIKMNFKFYKMSSKRVLAGVCAGIADSSGVDPTIIRIIAAVICIYFPFLILLYLLLAIILPEKSIAEASDYSADYMSGNSTSSQWTYSDPYQTNTDTESSGENINDPSRNKTQFSRSTETNPPHRSNHVSNMIIAIILICGGVGLFITKVLFNYSIQFNDFITFMIFGAGLFLMISGLLEDKAHKSSRTTKITIGAILTAVSFSWILQIFGYAVITMSELIASVRFLWPLFIIAVGLNILFPNKKATLSIWIGIIVIILLATVYRSMFGMFNFMYY